MNRQRLVNILERIPALRVLVVGDFFLDKYLHIERILSEISLETNLEAHQVIDVHVSPGAAGTVVNNLVALGARVAALGVIGDTGEGYEFRRALDTAGVDHSHMLLRPELLMPTYTKPMMYERDGRVHELERLDIKNRLPLAEPVVREFMVRLEAAVSQADAVIVSEYIPADEGGVISDAVREKIGTLAQAHRDRIFLTDSRPATALYRHVIVKCNLREAARALDLTQVENLAFGEIENIARRFEQKTGNPLFLTLGERGMLVCAGQVCTHVPTLSENGPLDSVGAGDSAIAGIACGLVAGATYTEAALLGNLAAAVTVRKIGMTGTATPMEVLEKFTLWNMQQNRDAKGEYGKGRKDDAAIE